MRISCLWIALSFLILGGCYHMGPDEDAVSTVPVTNNPNAMPGPMSASPLPSVF